MDEKSATTQVIKPQQNVAKWSTWMLLLTYSTLYFGGILTFLLIISDPLAMSTYFSDNSLLPGLVNREFSLVTEAEYYLKTLEKSVTIPKSNSLATDDSKLLGDSIRVSLANVPNVASYIKNELDNFGLEVYEQSFTYVEHGRHYNGTNIYSIIRGERSANSESIVLCAPFRKNRESNTMSSVALTLAIAKYFSTKSYWAKDVIILIVDQDEFGLSTWLDSYYDVMNKSMFEELFKKKEGLYYDQLVERSGPIQAAIVLELSGRQFSRINLKIQGLFGQLPNLDLFNLVTEMAARESVTPYFHNKSFPFGISSDLELYQHHFETALSFMKQQATMQSDGLHGLFLRFAIQSLTLEAAEHKRADRHVMVSSLLNVGRLVEGVFRSLNNLTERFNRSYYFYIILSLRRFTSIGYYMVGYCLIIAPVLLKTYIIYQSKSTLYNSLRAIVILASALALSLISTFNISTATFLAVSAVPILLII